MDEVQAEVFPELSYHTVRRRLLDAAKAGTIQRKDFFCPKRGRLTPYFKLH